MSTKSENSESLWMKIGGDGFEMKIVDGILYIRTQSAMLGYLNAPSPFDEEGWFNTKDKVEEKDGYIRILGRTTDYCPLLVLRMLMFMVKQIQSQV